MSLSFYFDISTHYGSLDSAMSTVLEPGAASTIGADADAEATATVVVVGAALPASPAPEGWSGWPGVCLELPRGTASAAGAVDVSVAARAAFGGAASRLRAAGELRVGAMIAPDVTVQ